MITAWKVSKYGAFSGSYFPVFGLRVSPYSVGMRGKTNQKKLRIWTLFTQWIFLCIRQFILQRSFKAWMWQNTFLFIFKNKFLVSMPGTTLSFSLYLPIFFILYTFLSFHPVETGRKLNVHWTFRRRPGRLLNVLRTFNLPPVSTGKLPFATFMIYTIYH